MMTVRLILAVISTLVEEAALVAIVLLVLPQFGIRIPLAGLIALMVALGVFAVITYRLGSRALRRGKVVGLPDMIGTQGKVVKPLDPEGLVRVRGELWVATSAEDEMQTGTLVTVVGQERLKLIVRESNPTTDAEKTG